MILNKITSKLVVMPWLMSAMVWSMSVMGLDQAPASTQERMAELQSIMRNAATNGINEVDYNRVMSLGDGNSSVGEARVAISERVNTNEQRRAPDPAFAETVKQLIPMSPEQINKLKEVYAETQAAAAMPPGSEAKPTASALAVDLSPNATPPVVRLGGGYITSLVFLDASGQPWPIAAYSLGDPNSFNIQWDRKGNTLLVQSSTFFRNSNLAVILKDLNTPVMVTLMSGQGAIDYRVDLRVPGFGPNAVFLRNSVSETADPLLLDILNGIPPAQAKEIKISGVSSSECRAWMLNKQLYVRTTMHIISPGWQSVMGSVDGMRAYRMQYAPVLLVTRNGSDQLINLSLGAAE